MTAFVTPSDRIVRVPVNNRTVIVPANNRTVIVPADGGDFTQMLVKAPADVLDYEWDWLGDGWLPTGDTIDTVTWTAQSGISIPDLNAPVNLAATGSDSGGALTAGTYYYKVTTLSGSGETTTSNEASAVTTGSTSSVTLTWDADSVGTGTKIYRGTAAGAENVLVATLSGTAQTYTDTGGATTSATPPSVNTAQAVSQTPTSATVFISGGTAGTGYDLTCQISTEFGRVGQNTQTINVVDL